MLLSATKLLQKIAVPRSLPCLFPPQNPLESPVYRCCQAASPSVQPHVVARHLGGSAHYEGGVRSEARGGVFLGGFVGCFKVFGWFCRNPPKVFKFVLLGFLKSPWVQKSLSRVLLCNHVASSSALSRSRPRSLFRE